MTTDTSGRVAWLFLGANELRGPIPPELGASPRSLGAPSGLDHLGLANNVELSGCVPLSLQAVSYNDFLELGLPFCE